MIKHERYKLFLFFTYTILYEFLIWSLVASAIYFLNWNEWTVLVGLCMSMSQLTPKYFGLTYTIDENEQKESESEFECNWVQ